MNMRQVAVLLFVIGFALQFLVPLTVAVAGEDLEEAGVFLELQGWRWQEIIASIPAIRDAGYTAILLSPHTASCSGPFGGQGYDPSDFTSFDGGFGGEAELVELLRVAHDSNVLVYANMVVNHMCAGRDYTYRRFSWNDFHHNGPIVNWTDPAQLENNDLEGLNDLAQESDYVRVELANYFKKTDAMGFDGYRFDGAKHVPHWYWRDDVAPNVRAAGKFSFGEVYDANLDLLQGYADTGMAVTDYNLYFAMMRAFTLDGDLAALDGAGYALRNAAAAVTFAENHDVAPPTNRLLSYAFLAGYPGYPMFAGIDLHDGAINNLVWVHNHLATGSYINRWKEHNVFAFERLGHLIVGINQSATWETRWIDTSWASTVLHDYSGHAVDTETAGDRRLKLAIPPMSYVMFAPEIVAARPQSPVLP